MPLMETERPAKAIVIGRPHSDSDVWQASTGDLDTVLQTASHRVDDRVL